MMKQTLLGIVIVLSMHSFAQDLETLNGKDFRQPGKLNPSLSGLQEDLVRVLTDADVGNTYQLMLEGKLPFKLGNYMIGVERLYNDYAENYMFNISYGRTSKTDKKHKLRYGGSLQINQRELFKQDFDSAKGYSFIDLNGDLVTVPALSDLNSSLDYINLEFGISLTYDHFIASFGIDNAMKQNVSFDRNETRNLPLTANVFAGGFLSIGKKYTLFPSLLGSYHKENYYMEAAIDFNTPYFNLGSGYIAFEDFEAVSASLAFSIKKMFLGLEYQHPIEAPDNILQYPRFNLFFNSTVFKSRGLFKSDFAQLMKKFY